MNKAELINTIAKKSNVSFKCANDFLDILLETISEELVRGGKIKFVDFGTFEVAKRAPRKGYNPHACKEIIIPACNEPIFKPGKALKAIVNQ